MKKFSGIIAVATLALLATASPALATRHHPHHMMPFKGSVLALDNGQIFPTEEEPLDCPKWAEWQFFSRGTGQMSRLGQSELDLVQCSKYVDPPFVGKSKGTTTFTAANGDVLVLAHKLTFKVYFGDITDPDGNPVPDGFKGKGTWTVLDGTGRFAHATGSGKIAVRGDVPTDDTPMFDLPAGGTLWSFKGMIAYGCHGRAPR